MADAVNTAIRAALGDRYQALVLSPPLPIALENVPFTPPLPGQNVGWLRSWVLPAPDRELCVDFGSENEHRGIFQVDVMYGPGSGLYAPQRIADAVLAWFRRGTVLRRDGFTVRINGKPYPGALVPDPPWVKIVVSVPYVAYAVST